MNAPVSISMPSFEIEKSFPGEYTSTNCEGMSMEIRPVAEDSILLSLLLFILYKNDDDFESSVEL